MHKHMDHRREEDGFMHFFSIFLTVSMEKNLERRCNCIQNSSQLRQAEQLGTKRKEKKITCLL